MINEESKEGENSDEIDGLVYGNTHTTRKDNKEDALLQSKMKKKPKTNKKKQQ